MELFDYVKYTLTGLRNNLLVTGVTFLVLLIPGILLTLLSKKFPIVGKIFGWLSIPFECICPIIFIMVLYWGFAFLTGGSTLPVTLATILCLILSFMGYMPARYTPEYSIWKNILYYGLGMLSAIFKWSFTAHVIGFTGLYYFAGIIKRQTFLTFETFIIPLIVSFVILLFIEIARIITKQFMK